MRHQKSPFILLTVAVALLATIAFTKGLGGKVGTAEELNEQYAKEQAERQEAMKGKATGDPRNAKQEDQAKQLAAEMSKRKAPRPDQNPTKGDESMVFTQKPMQPQKPQVNPSTISPQWYRENARVGEGK